MRSYYSDSTKQEVLALGTSGKTYREIQELYPIPKSTLSYWFKNAGQAQDRTKQLEHLARIRPISNKIKHEQKQSRIETSKTDALAVLGDLPLENISVCKSMLAMLYWAEGGKQEGNLKFTNTDPVLALLFITLFRACYSVDEGRFRVALQVHDYHDQEEVLSFWSKKLNLPTSQFWKIYVKKRSVTKKFRRNFMGICHIHYSSSAIQRELLALGVAIAEKVEKEAPVVQWIGHDLAEVAM
jgi:hypothetical protein